MTTIHTIRLKFSNCYQVSGARNILVDTGSPGEAQNIIHKLQALGVGLSDISLILHTHGHADHCGSTVELLQQQKIPTAIHSADSHMTERGQNSPLKSEHLIARLAARFIDRPFPAFRADIFVDNYTDLSEFGCNGTLHSTRGHTSGSISIEFDSQEAIIGDVLMGGFVGGLFFPSTPGYPYVVEDAQALETSINKILDFNANTFYVGHGGPLSRERIKKKFHQPART